MDFPPLTSLPCVPKLTSPEPLLGPLGMTQQDANQQMTVTFGGEDFIEQVLSLSELIRKRTPPHPRPGHVFIERITEMWCLVCGEEVWVWRYLSRSRTGRCLSAHRHLSPCEVTGSWRVSSGPASAALSCQVDPSLVPGHAHLWVFSCGSLTPLRESHSAASRFHSLIHSKRIY